MPLIRHALESAFVEYAGNRIDLSQSGIPVEPTEFVLQGADMLKQVAFDHALPSITFTFELDPTPVFLFVQNKSAPPRLVVTTWGYVKLCLLLSISPIGEKE